MIELVLLASCAVLIVFAVILYTVMVSFDNRYRKLMARLSNHRDALLMLRSTLFKIEEEKSKDNHIEERVKALEESVRELRYISKALGKE